MQRLFRYSLKALAVQSGEVQIGINNSLHAENKCKNFNYTLCRSNFFPISDCLYRKYRYVLI